MRTIMSSAMVAVVLGALSARAGRVTVTNVSAAQRARAPVVDIAYDLLNPSGGLHSVWVHVSTNGGASYNVCATNFIGAVGANISTGRHKEIVWLVAGDLPGVSGVTARVRVTAMDDGADTNEMVLIPPGSFTMGNTFSEGSSNELPLHSVYISAFYMDKTEVTKAKWDEVYTWAVAHGYSFDNAGSGKAPNHPVHTVSWYDCVKWCNARSQKEGLTPCYYTSSTFTLANLYTNGNVDIAAAWVNWSANGYRLPTEAEWEKAARGGAAGHRFPWSDSDWIDFSRANYYSYWSDGVPYFSYDHATQAGHHPAFATGDYPYTSPVGYFAPNGYGLYDMAGNVWEWCWDWYDSSWYSNGSATHDDTSGPASGAERVLRGGGWDNSAWLCRAAARNIFTPDYAQDYGGFRAVRR